MSEIRILPAKVRGTEPAGIALPKRTGPRDIGARPLRIGSHEVRRHLRSRLRQSFEQIKRYLALGRQTVERESLGAMTDDLIDRAAELFVCVGALRGTGAAMSLGQVRCITELDNFARLLRGSSPLQTHVIAHALDSLIVECVLLHAELDDT